MTEGVPVTVAIETSDYTDDFSVTITHDIIPGLRLAMDATNWANFCLVDWEAVTKNILRQVDREWSAREWKEGHHI